MGSRFQLALEFVDEAPVDAFAEDLPWGEASKPPHCSGIGIGWCSAQNVGKRCGRTGAPKWTPTFASTTARRQLDPSPLPDRVPAAPISARLAGMTLVALQKADAGQDHACEAVEATKACSAAGPGQGGNPVRPWQDEAPASSSLPPPRRLRRRRGRRGGGRPPCAAPRARTPPRASGPCTCARRPRSR